MFIKKILRRIRETVKTSQKDLLLNKDPFQKFGIPLKNVELKEDGTFLVTLHDDLTLISRNIPHSDIQVFEQVFVDLEYALICNFFKNNTEKLPETPIIIDAGANVGYTTLFFLNSMENPKIISIEPDSNNYNLLLKNIDLSSKKNNVIPLNSALLGKENVQLKTNADFRDGKDWAITVSETKEKSDLHSVSIPQLMKLYSLTEIDILKIDIEGAERFLFLSENDLEYLKNTKSIIIEIHDEFDCREMIYSTFKKYNFLIVDAGESTLAINKKYW